jgi:hypothetical protein
MGKYEFWDPSLKENEIQKARMKIKSEKEEFASDDKYYTEIADKYNNPDDYYEPEAGETQGIRRLERQILFDNNSSHVVKELQELSDKKYKLETQRDEIIKEIVGKEDLTPKIMAQINDIDLRIKQKEEEMEKLSNLN